MKKAAVHWIAAFFIGVSFSLAVNFRASSRASPLPHLIAFLQEQRSFLWERACPRRRHHWRHI